MDKEMYFILCFGGISFIAVSMGFHQRRHSVLRSKAAAAAEEFPAVALAEDSPAAVLAAASLEEASAAVPAEVGNMK